MKIKIQDYSLISNETIEAELKLAKENLDKNPYSDFNAGRLNVLEDLKDALISSEKLAASSFDAGERYGWDSQKSIGNIDKMREAIPFKSKQDFLKSEIKI